jgi:hydroxymethylbilane synthase
MNEIRIATRRSSLAVRQAERVADLLSGHHPGLTVRMVEVDTEGDRDRTRDISSLNEIGAFVTAVQEAVLDGRADLAVHSLKDLPTGGQAPLTLAAYPERVSPLDVMVGRPLGELAPGSVVGTGSPRRSAQLLEMRPDITTVGLRGNVDTRVRKVNGGDVDGAVLAEAGLDRLGMSSQIVQKFNVTEMTPAPGQGALGVEARPNSEAAEIVAAIDDPRLRRLLTAERELLSRTGAGCRSALGALATDLGDSIRMDLFVSDESGSRRASVDGRDVETVVAAACQELGL